MKKAIAAALAVAVLLLTAACSKNTGSVKLADEADSLAYIIGMNVGMNLQRMDSSIRVDAVCEGIRDYLGGNARFTVEEARTYYLRHITYERPERIRAYEEQFLEDIRQSNRSYARTKSGLTYTVEAVGDETFTPANARDTVWVRYVMRTADGKQLYSSYDRGDTVRAALGDLLKGLQESVRLIGKGGKMEAWVPAASAYGAAGDSELGVAPNATLFFEIELVDVDKYSARRRSGSQLF